VLRNGLARFQTAAGRFGLAPKSKVVFTRPFQGEVAAVSHQIGPCQATPTGLSVSVGDGEQPKSSRDLQPTLGKILRLTLDGRPDPSNPYTGSGPSGAAAYVWASGF